MIKRSLWITWLISQYLDFATALRTCKISAQVWNY